MNPYKQLERVAGFRGFSATLTKRDGTELTMKVKAEEISDERLESSYPSSLRVRAWSAPADSFVVRHTDRQATNGSENAAASGSSQQNRLRRADAFIYEDGTLGFPADGDRLTVQCRDGKTRVFATARDATTSRYWNWRYSTPGGRIVFYTKTEGLELE